MCQLKRLKILLLGSITPQMQDSCANTVFTNPASIVAMQQKNLRVLDTGQHGFVRPGPSVLGSDSRALEFPKTHGYRVFFLGIRDDSIVSLSQVARPSSCTQTAAPRPLSCMSGWSETSQKQHLIVAGAPCSASYRHPPTSGQTGGQICLLC